MKEVFKSEIEGGMFRRDREEGRKEKGEYESEEKKQE